MVTITRRVLRSGLISSTLPVKLLNGPSMMRTFSLRSKLSFGRGRSAEAEHRAILEHALLGAPPEQDFKAFLKSIPTGVEFNVRRSRDRSRPVRL